MGIGSGWIGFGRALIWSRFWLVVTHDIPLIYVHFKYKPFLDFVNYKIDIFWQSTTKRVCFYNFFITSSRKYSDSLLNEIHLDGITDGNCDRIDGVIPLQHRTVIVVGEECRLDLVPEKYRSEDRLGFLKNTLESFRASTIPEAINIYESEQKYRELADQNKKLLEIQQLQTQEILSLKSKLV